jgi:transposase-like protein
MGGPDKEIEADETYVGGLAKNMHASSKRRKLVGAGHVGKTAVMGLLERHSEKGKSKVRTSIVPNTGQRSIHEVIHKNVEPESKLYTDAFQSYRGLTPEYFHDFVDHTESYVRGNVHTNGLENFWSLFKRCIKGTHVSIEPFHMVRYLDAECFRFNNRSLNDAQRFVLALGGISGKRLTYEALTGALEFQKTSQGSGAARGRLPN